MNYKFNNRNYKTINSLIRALVKRKEELINDIQRIVKSKQNKKTKKANLEIYNREIKTLNDRIKNHSLTLERNKKETKNRKLLLKNLPSISNNVMYSKNNKTKIVTFDVTLYQQKQDNKKTYRNHEIITDDEGIKHTKVTTLRITLKRIDVYKYLRQINVFHKFKTIEEHNEFFDTLKKYEPVRTLIENMLLSINISGYKILNKHEENRQYNPYNAYDEFFEDDNDNNVISSKYTKYSLNLESKNFKNLLQNNHIEYVKKNFHPRSCFLTAIINKFYDKFNKKKTDGKRAYKELTYKNLADILKIEYKEEGGMAIQIKQVVDTFFTRFKFAGLKIYDQYMNILLNHEPTNKSNSAVLRLMAVGNHLYELNDNLDSLKGKESVNIDVSDKPIVKVSDKYRIIENNKEDKTKEIFINGYDEESENYKDSYERMIKEIKKYGVVDEYERIKIITNLNLDKILINIVNDGYIPKVYYHNFVYKISFMFEHKKKDKFVDIECCDKNPVYGKLMNEGYLQIDNLEDYKAYNKIYQETYEKVIKPEFLSDTNEEVRKIEDEYKINAVQGCFSNIKTSSSNGKSEIIDENKAYTKKLMDIKKIPVFNYFDVYRKYDNHEIEELTYYIIDLSKNNDESIKCLFDKKINRVFGFVLKNVTTLKYDILYYRRPSKFIEVDFETPVNELYNNDKINKEVKKNIINKITGLMEQKHNKAHNTKIFKSYNEAKYYSIKYNANEPLSIINFSDDYEIEEVVNKSGQIKTIFTPKKTSEKIYIVNVENKERLTNGLYPIKDIIYLQQRLKMYKLYEKMNKLGYKILGIKTDCLYYEGDTKLLSKHFDICDKIGSYKIESNKFVPENELMIRDNEIIEIYDYFENNKIKTFKDEYDTKKINKHINKNKNIMIEGLYPGVGKSTLAKNYSKESLFVCPYNKLCQVIKKEGFDSVTYNKIFGLFGAETENTIMKKFDISKYKVIVFDEIYLYEPIRLKKIDLLIKSNPDKIFMATGDCDQRDPIGYNDSEYIKNCINIIFKNKIILNDIKRLKNEEDKEKWKLLKDDVLNSELSIEEICIKHKLNMVKEYKDIKTKKNVAYFNFRCNQVNNLVHNNILKFKEEYFNDLNIICKKYCNKKGQVLNTNYTYKIIDYDKDKNNVTILDELEDKKYFITQCQLKSDFRLPYCYTCDSIQGLSFEEDDEITIFDSNTAYVDRKYLWTAITRCRQLKNVNIYIHPEEELTRLKYSRMELYFREKVQGYKYQDRIANREIDNEEYIDNHWIINKVIECKFSCKYCKERMNVNISNDGNITSNITVDRINNKKSHTKNNCQICCSTCNSKKSNRKI